MPRSLPILADRVVDKRTKRVVFLSHCLLHENTRYLGGAGCPSCVREVVEQCVENDVGIVQMPCPEAAVRGGCSATRGLAAPR